MENHPETPISNRGFNAQFLSIVPYSTPPASRRRHCLR